MSKYRSTKTYPFSAGLSCAFRQWRANSHCRHLHGYALQFRFTFESEELDVRNWVMDFGGLQEVKGILTYYFDHKTLVAKDDPHIAWFQKGAELGVINPIYLDNVGCERVSELIFNVVKEWLKEKHPWIRLVEVECAEHDGNSAIYTEDISLYPVDPDPKAPRSTVELMTR